MDPTCQASPPTWCSALRLLACAMATPLALARRANHPPPVLTTTPLVCFDLPRIARTHPCPHLPPIAQPSRPMPCITASELNAVEIPVALSRDYSASSPISIHQASASSPFPSPSHPSPPFPILTERESQRSELPFLAEMPPQRRWCSSDTPFSPSPSPCVPGHENHFPMLILLFLHRNRRIFLLPQLRPKPLLLPQLRSGET